jgi:hypothetical protein
MAWQNAGFSRGAHCHRAGFDLFSLRAFTLDRFGRYAYAATRFAPG